MNAQPALQFCFAFLHLFALASTLNIYDGVSEGGQNGNPGLKLRITQRGLDYMNSILLYEMNEIIPHLHVDDMGHSEGNGHLHITKGRVTGYKPPNTQTLRLSPPDQIIWSSSGANIAMSGHVQGSYGRFSDEGDVDIFANDVTFEIGIQPTRQAGGHFGAKTRSCTSDIGNLDFNVYNAGFLGRFLQNNKGVVLRRLGPRIAHRLCQQASKLIDHAANEQLANMPTKIPLNESADHIFNRAAGQDSNSRSSRGKSNQKPTDSDNFFADETDGHDGSGEARHKLTSNITKHLTFDYGNIKDPVVQSRFLETYNRGEISYHGQGGTPFAPSALRESTVQSDRMVYALASDYVANSMLYNAYSHDLLKTHISGDETPNFKSYLKTTCDGDGLFDMCLGSIIPEMQESFPDSQAEIYFEATKAPALFFRKEGTVNILGQGITKLVAARRGEKRTMLVADIDMTSTAKLFFNDNKVKGNCTINKYNVTIKQNNLKGFNKDRQKEFIDSTRNLMEVLANSYLRNGLRLPSMKAVKLQNPKLTIFERTARIESDVEADKATLTKMAISVIQKHGGHVDGY